METLRFFDDVSLPGNGTIGGAFWDKDHKTFAITSSFRLLTEPRARAAYGGHRLRHRLSLYSPPSTSRIAAFDGSAFPINDVAFHPSKSLVAIATGSYDGGFLFEGQLFLWDWISGRSSSVTKSLPEVLRVRFSNDGKLLRAIVRPWDEEQVAAKGDPFELSFHLSLDVDQAWSTGAEDRDIAAQIERQEPQPTSKLTEDGNFPTNADPKRNIERAFGISQLKARSPIWDVAFLGANAVATVHDDCLLNVRGRDDDSGILELKGEGHGVQLFPQRSLLVHVSHFNSAVRDPFEATKTELLALSDNELKPITSLIGAFTFSSSRNGIILGRLNRSFGSKHLQEDAIIGLQSGIVTRRDLGHYDVFNHYLRVDGAPHLFFVQGTPPNSHERKHLCIVTPEGEVQRLWPLLPDNGDQASHAMECCFGYVEDNMGAGLIVAGRHYNSSPAKAYSGFIYRKNMSDGKELWRHKTDASVTMIKCVPDGTTTVVAFLDGNVAAFESDTGEILAWSPLKVDGIANVAFSLAVDASHAVFGLLDGRYGMCELSELLQP